MKLLRELHEVEILTEAVDNKKYYYLEGVFMQSEVKNRNGRCYPKPIMENGVNNYISNYVNKKTSYGELGHSDKPGVNLERVSHLIENLSWQGNDVIGRAKILDTNQGLIAQKILEGGGKLGVSSKALGSLRESNGAMVVQSDFMITTAGDIVSDPSAPKAFVNSILEDTEWFLNLNGEIVQKKVEQITEAAKNMTKAERSEKAVSLFEDFLKSLKK